MRYNFPHAPPVFHERGDGPFDTISDVLEGVEARRVQAGTPAPCQIKQYHGPTEVCPRQPSIGLVDSLGA